MTNLKKLTRTCSACGIEKPLSAFLQISGTQGTLYGAICATCRSAGITGKKPTTSLDEGTTSASSGSRIGVKEKVFIEKEQFEKKELKKIQPLNTLNNNHLTHPQQV